MPVTYDPAIIALSVVIAIQGGYVSLILARRLAGLGLAPSVAGRRKALLAGSALALGVGIWAMHFIGMLALRMDVGSSYAMTETFVSLGVVVIAAMLGAEEFGIGTISLIAGTSASIEPLFALAYHRHALDGKVLRELNPLFVKHAQRLGIYDEALAAELARVGTLGGIERVPEAVRHGVPTRLLTRMGLNIAADTAVGAIPVIGFLFDMAFKANTRNLNLLRQHLAETHR